MLFKEDCVDKVTLPFDQTPNHSLLHSSGDANFIVSGYRIGTIVIYSMTDEAMKTYRLHSSSILSMKILGDSLWILHDDNIVTVIKDVGHLFRLKEEEAYSIISKYRLKGPNLESQTISDIALSSPEHLIAVGSHPFIQVYKISHEADIILDELDALKIKAKQTAGKMSSFAKNLWSRNSSTSDVSQTDESSSVLALKRIIDLEPAYFLRDGDRQLNHVELNCDGKCALISDTFNGRLLLWEVDAGILTRQWKGYRAVQFQWHTVDTAVILAPKQRFLEVRNMMADERTGKLDLEETFPGQGPFVLVSSSILACASPDSVQLYKIT